MTDPTTYRESELASAEMQISFREDVAETDRKNAELSVAALVARSAEAVARRRATEAALAESTGALTRPFAKLIEVDPLSNEALEKLRSLQLMQPEAMDRLGPDTPFTLTYDSAVSTPRDGVGLRSQGFVPPYDFQWSWHQEGGHPPFNLIQNRFSGRLGLEARSGSIDGGAPGFVNAHAGFGVFVRSDVMGQKFPHAVLNPGSYSFQVRAVGVDSNATSEGGFDLAVFEDGRFLTGADRKLWRSRVSATLFDPDESASGGQGNHLIAGPELQFTMRPGHSYTFNAGIWVISDRSTGIGAGAAQSILRGTLTRMWVFG
jgi:hypothetical protein